MNTDERRTQLELENARLREELRILRGANGSGSRAPLSSPISRVEETRIEFQQHESYLQSLVELLPVGIITVNPADHCILDLNPCALRMLGRSKPDVVGQACHGFICPAEVGRCPITDLGMKVDQSERVLLAGDGDRIPVLKSVFMAEKGGAPVLVESFVDIRTRKQAEEQMRRVKNAAEAAHRAKSAFLASMSHELRTPLNAIIGYSELLSEEAKDIDAPGLISDAGKISQSAKRLLALINDVLEVSAIEAGRLDLRSQPVSVDEIISSVLPTVQETARKTSNRFDLICVGEFKLMWADPAKLRQSLLHLLNNACKFTHGGQVTLELKHEISGGREWIDWHVRDTGVGIAPEDREMLFEPFTQSGDIEANSPGSAGLGLAISRKLCRLMGGDITCQSQPGRGSDFTIRMPVAGDSGT